MKPSSSTCWGGESCNFSSSSVSFQDCLEANKLQNELATMRGGGGGDNDIGLLDSFKTFFLRDVESRTKFAVLCMMALQNASVILTMRHSRLRVERGYAKPYSSNTVILLQEVAKLPICFFALTMLMDDNEQSHSGFSFLIKETSMMDIIILIIPSLMYYLQNKLVHKAIKRLTAASFVVAYQLKLVFSTVLSELVFHRGLTATKWGSVVVLFIGVCLVNLESVAISEKKDASHSIPLSSSTKDLVTGLAAAIAGSFLSAFAGVYMEFVMKRMRNNGDGKRSKEDIVSDLKTKTINMWVRNAQLSILGSIIAFIPFLSSPKTWQPVNNSGIFSGFDSVVWSIVALQALGGLAVSASLIYADAVLKGFATSASLLLVGLFDSLILNEKLGGSFWFGAMMVVTSVWAYSQPKDVASFMFK